MIWISSPCGRTPGRDGPSWPDELLFYGSYHFECTRPAAGEPAYCTGGIGEPLGIGSRELAPFRLERGSVHLGERRDRRDMPYVTLVTPSGSLTNSAVLFVVSAGLPPGAEAGAPDGGGATSTGDGGSDGGTVAPIDGGTDGSGTPDAGVVASSCKALLASAPSTPSGRYVIDPDGAGAAAPFQVYCDMSTAGGGWTEVFLALPNLASSTLDYTSASPRLLADGTETLIAFRASSLAVSGTTAVFSLPTAWKTASPFKARNADLTVQVSIDGATPREGKLRYGTANFLDTCAGDWNLAEDWGRLCIAGTTAAFFVGWAIDEADTCQDSSKLWSAVDCASADRRFSISVR